MQEDHKLVCRNPSFRKITALLQKRLPFASEDFDVGDLDCNYKKKNVLLLLLQDET